CVVQKRSALRHALRQADTKIDDQVRRTRLAAATQFGLYQTPAMTNGRQQLVFRVPLECLPVTTKVRHPVSGCPILERAVQDILDVLERWRLAGQELGDDMADVHELGRDDEIGTQVVLDGFRAVAREAVLILGERLQRHPRKALFSLKLRILES